MEFEGSPSLVLTVLTFPVLLLMIVNASVAATIKSSVSCSISLQVELKILYRISQAITHQHDVSALLDAFDAAEQIKGHPTVILAQTVKGKCISFAENNAAFHNGLLTADQCKTALCDLENIRKGRA